MIIQKIINISPETNNNIELIKIYIAFIISFIISFLLIFYNTQYFLEICLNIFKTYVTIDLFFSTKDAVLHHIFGYLLCEYIFENNVDMMQNNYIYKTLLQTEISSIFLCIKLLIDFYKKDIETSKYNKIIKIYYPINDLIFISLFYKLRIHDFFFNIIQNENFYISIYSNIGDSIIKNIKLYISMYGLFILNIYWFSLICKKIYKTIIINNFPKLNTEICSEYILSYIFYINLLILFKYYTENYNKYLLFDLVGVYILSNISSTYHYEKYDYLIKNNNKIFDITSKQLLMPFIYDKYAIQLRSLFALISILLMKNIYNFYFYIHIIYHLISLFIFNTTIIKLLLENKKIIYDNSEESKKIIKKFDLLSSIPCLLDIISIIYYSNTIIQKTNLILVTILLSITLFIKPFYNLNHVLLHILIIFQTMCIVNCILDI
jgi:hypothetical protein